MYNLVRQLIAQAAAAHDKDPRCISFSDALQHLLEATPLLTALEPDQSAVEFTVLLAVIADCPIDHPRRPWINPRVVKVKMSKFKRKGSTDKSEYRDIAKELKIIGSQSDTSAELAIKLEHLAPTKNLTTLMIIATLAGATASIPFEIRT